MFTQLQMTYKTKADEVLDTPATSQVSTVKKSNVNTKNHAMLSKFVGLGLRGMNCFEAANKYHDYVLRSTIPILQRKYGIYFSRKGEKVLNAFGKLTTCARYWLNDENMAIAIAALECAEVTSV